jgi:tetratricopeptide (TPR) repeat protein
MTLDDLTYFCGLMKQADPFKDRAELEMAENALRGARKICQITGFPDVAQHKLDILIKLAEVKRRHGKYREAIDAHRQALDSKAMNKMMRIEVQGELGVNYRHADRMTDAKTTFQEQYELSHRLGLEIDAQACRAAGNLGMTLYQLYDGQQDQSDESLLKEAVRLLEERVRKAQELQIRVLNDPEMAKMKGRLRMWESIGHSRLSLAYAAMGETGRAVEHRKLTVEMSNDLPDPTVRAISRFFCGYALPNNGQREEAKAQFNFTASNGQCTPAIALCEELSEEHRQYLKVLVDVGVDLELHDEQGYSALDYAVYADDQAAAKIMLNGLLRAGVDIDEIPVRKNLALLRKHFREIFHAQFRPILQHGHDDCINNLRAKYVELLSTEMAKRERFGQLRLVSLKDFEEEGQLPKFHMHDRLTRTVTQIKEAETGDAFVIFFSYRWIGKDFEHKSSSPDDTHNSQYKRMLQAVNSLLDVHDSVDRENVYIWLASQPCVHSRILSSSTHAPQDCACIDQEDIEAGRRERGINALPIYVAQCNAVISLVDDRYLTRAWCGVEVLIMQTLRESSKLYTWWKHRLHSPADRINGILEEGSEEKVQPSALALSHEGDRRHIQFLERQSMLLGKAACGA